MISDNEKGNPYHDENGQFASGSSGDKLGKMGFGPEKSQNKIDNLKKDFEKHGTEIFNWDAGFMPGDHGYENTGYEDLAVDLQFDGEKYLVYEYLENEDGPVGWDDPEVTQEFDTIEELNDYLEKEYGNSNPNERLSSYGFGGK